MGRSPTWPPSSSKPSSIPARWDAVGAGADLYSLGLVMFELLTGEAPEVPDQSLPLPRAIRGLLDRRIDQLFVPRRLNPAIPHALEAIALRCLAHDEAKRYPSAQALADDLQMFLQDQPLRHAVNPSVAERLGNWSRRHWYILAASVLLGIAGLYATVRHLTPVEHDRAFQAALEAIESGDHQRALRLLGPLAEDYPRSPLVLFYYSLELAQAKQVDCAGEIYDQALQAPRADAVFDEWAKKSPGLVTKFESLGMKFNEERTIPGSRLKQPRMYPDLAHEAFAVAIRLGSTNDKMFLADVCYDQERGYHDLALNTLTALISRVEHYPRAERDRTLNVNNCYRYRARVLNQLGNLWLAEGSPAALAKAKSDFSRAIADLNRGRLLIARGDADRHYNSDMYLATARIGLGFVAVGQARFDDARIFQGIKDILARQAEAHDSEDNFKKVEERLATLDSKIPANLAIAR